MFIVTSSILSANLAKAKVGVLAKNNKQNKIIFLIYANLRKYSLFFNSF